MENFIPAFLTFNVLNILMPHIKKPKRQQFLSSLISHSFLLIQLVKVDRISILYKIESDYRIIVIFIYHSKFLKT